MQKTILTVLVIILILTSVNLVWIAVLHKDFSSAIEIANVFYEQANTPFMHSVLVAKESSAVERFAFVARGSIKEVSNEAITLENSGEILEFSIFPYVEVVRQISPDMPSEKITIQDLSVGEEVLCSVEISKEGRQGVYRLSLVPQQSE